MILSCMAVDMAFEWLEKARPAVQRSVGCTLLQASMSHSKGGSEDVCVNYNTSTALALASLDVTLERCTKAYILTFISVVSCF